MTDRRGAIGDARGHEVTGDATARTRIGHLYDYLGALAQEVYAKPVRHLGDYDAVASPEVLPLYASVRVGEAAGDAWLRVGKTPKPRPPACPPAIADVLQDVARDDPSEPPELPEDADEKERAVFERWRADVWDPWAETARVAVAARELYETLFRLRQRMRADEATHELVWGHGVLGWNHGGHRICHPLLVTRMRIVFEQESGEIAIVPDGAPVLETDFLQGLGVAGLDRLEELRGTAPDPWAPEEARPFYRRVVTPLGLDGRLAAGDGLPEVGDAPVVGETWRLVVRKRRVMFLRFFERLKKAVEEGDRLPAPMVALAAGEDAARDVLAAGADDWAPVAERLLLPLAANDEQEQIARKLARHSGVTVQGPPGTGKSHTIANLVSHLVAHGKRVLVTAHKDQALAVLREKIPKELRDLSLAVLGSSSAHLTELQGSVQAITAAADSVNVEREKSAVAALRERLDEVERDVLVLRKRLRESLEREQETLEIGGLPRRAADVAAWLAEHEDGFGRIPDALAESAVPPLSGPELVELYGLAAAIGERDAAAAATDLPPAERLPAGAELGARWDELRRLDEALAGYRDYVEDLARVDAAGDAELGELAERCGSAGRGLGGLQEPWLLRLRDQVVQGQQWHALWAEHARRLGTDAAECARLRTACAGAAVEVPPGPYRETLSLLEQARARFAQGKRVSPLTQRALAQFLKAATLDGESPRTVADVDRIAAFVELRRRRESAARLWNDELVATLGAPEPQGGAVEIWIDAKVRQIVAALTWETAGWPDLRGRLCRVMSAETVPARPVPDDLHRLADVLGGLRARARQRQLQGEMDALAGFLAEGRGRPGASPLWTDLATAAAQQDRHVWEAALASSVRLAALRPRAQRLGVLHDRLAAVAPRWAALIRSTGGDVAECGDPARLDLLWRWRQAETWLRAIIDAGDLASVQRRLDEAQDEQRRHTLDLTRRAAWLAMKRNLGATQRQALVGWLQTLRKIGKGTGAGANKWRAEAQRLMPEAMGAVPVWIMPYYRVAESFDPAVAPRFDVVVIDESSQCDVFALGLLGLGHKVVVVGDDKQISPSAVGVRRDRVDELIRTHLPDFPNALLLDMESSLYDASARLFPGVVRLREHFRCLPRIIEFSSQHYYGGEIQPLREESADRPPGPIVRAVHVPDGVRRDLPIGNVNEAEADALVDQVVQCCSDPAYNGRTMGVISLLGTSRQAQYIDQALLAKLGPEEYERRRLRCGDAYGFQGDERDVVFISVVADSNRAPFTSRQYEQRVNVAASRARDQMWVFHSVKPHELHPDDQRGHLIRYATDGQRSADLARDLEARCDSDFERRVLRMLLARDYLVTPQHPVGNLRIDLVVRGGDGAKLAIECDGDKFHGPDQWEDDLRRQTVLERLGWRFWRVRGSVFYRDPEAAMSGLWPLLDDLGITPGPAPDTDPAPARPPVPPANPAPVRVGVAPGPDDFITAFDVFAPPPAPAPEPEPGPQAPAHAEPSRAPEPSGPIAPPDVPTGGVATIDQVRAWARATGRHVGARGRLAKAVIDDYNWEHPEALYDPDH
ncbi:AAA domain-containing protein [Actinomadura violacea]|uniref:AAA family ATPase n=1 Tax=Actinomadura violacea TaxID=2819934 RepID=A0ABS3RMJ6_9ACTN|nr:AAA domain-containing protein [Actinomadura violacea]MBO2457299.1 AAA family ATPase [Actinomadura violacea]